MDQIRADEALNVTPVNVTGMHCINCAVLIERRFKTLSEVRRVMVNYPAGYALVTHAGTLDLTALQSALGDDGYTVSARDPNQPLPVATGNSGRDYLEIAAAFLVLAGLAALLHELNLLPRGLSVSDSMSYGLVFVIGLVASVSSCLAVTGGLLVAIAAKYSEANPQLSDRERLIPHLYFNAGRIISYTLLGGLVGAVGSALTLSPAASGILMVLASVIMIVLGLQMLKLLPTGLMPTMPKALAHGIHDLATRDSKEAAFALGAATFFLPCGFTQGLQLTSSPRPAS
jgi:copper chaperone CopZ